MPKLVTFTKTSKGQIKKYPQHYSSMLNFMVQQKDSNWVATVIALEILYQLNYLQSKTMPNFMLLPYSWKSNEKFHTSYQIVIAMSENL